MASNLKSNFIRASALGFFAFLVIVVIIADRGDGEKWWPFLGHIPYGDKFGHIGLFGILGFLCNLAFPNRWPSRLAAFITKTTFVLIVIVSLEELSQAFFPSRTLDPIDWLSDLTGLAIGQIAALVILRKPSDTKPIQHCP
jgi:hypothetical protein